MERKEYFQKMRETSEVVDPIILESVSYLKETNKELYEFIINIPAFKKRVEKKDKLRPFLLRLSYELAGGTNWQEIANTCAAVEILNISTYIDNSFFDNKNDIKEKDKVNYVISARVLRNIAEKLLRKIDNKNSESLIELLREIDHDIYVAQFEDLNQVRKERKFNDNKDYLSAYLRRCEGLTGRFFENIARIGAVLAEAKEDQINYLGIIGRNIGIVDQIVNDIGDFVPPNENVVDFEKVYQDQFNDIKAGKLTLPIYYVLNFGSDMDKEVIKRVLGNKKAANGELDSIAETLAKSGAIQYAKETAKEYAKEAKLLLNNFKSSESRDYLKMMSSIYRTNKYMVAFRILSHKITENQDKIILVDENDREIGIEEKIKAHKEGRLHRAFSVFIFNSKGELLIQRRAKDKYHSGGAWSNTTCGHPRAQESTSSAAHRRLFEEMGFDCELKEVFRFHYKTKLKNDLIENEIDHIFIGEFNEKPKPNPLEVEKYQWISIKDLKQDITKNPEKYSYWFRELIKKRF